MFEDLDSVSNPIEGAAVEQAVKRIELFPDQSDVLLEAQSHLMAGKKVILQMPTGGGKTVMAAKFVQMAAKNSRVWFVCHLRQLVRQTSETFTSYGIGHGIIANKYDQTPDANVQVASVQTLKWRSSRFGDPDIIIWDECQHIAANSWAALMAQFPNARHIGLTATPERLDGKGLGDWFDVLVKGPSNKELIRMKRLSDFRMFVPSEPDLTNARIQAGDYHKGDIDKVMNTPVLIGDAVDHYKRLVDGKRALVFATSVAASENIVERFNAAGVASAHIDGTTPDDIRKDIVDRLATGELKVVSNVDVFGEGFDLPSLDCVILMRPTRSLAKYLQMVGRVLRIDEGKDDTLILDHAGCYYEHGTPDIEWEWSLEGGARKRRIAKMRETGERIGRKCPQCSRVHVERVMVCDCGYEFPSGREVGEFDGVLSEINGIPEGCVTKLEFSRLIGLNSSKSITDWVRRGMPNINGYPVVSDALEWMSETGAKKRIEVFKRPVIDGYVSRKEFSEEYKVSVAQVEKWILKGLPTYEGRGGWPSKESGDDWVKKNINSIYLPPYREDDWREYQSPTDFARRHNVSLVVLNRWKSKGMPCAYNGWIHARDGDDWVKDSGYIKKIEDENSGKYVNKKEFARRAGIPNSESVTRMIKRGMPASENGWPELERALDWYRNKWHPSGVPPRDVDNPSEYETGRDFAKRVGVSETLVTGYWRRRGIPTAKNGWIHIQDGLNWARDNCNPVTNSKDHENLTAFGRRVGHDRTAARRWKRNGMPTLENGWVHIQTALEWVRNNTNIEIPPEAWPKKDDSSSR